MVEITQTEGKRAFGGDPAGYHEARPGYPEKVFDILRDRCGIRSGSRVFEVGPGTGIASQKLLQLGANPLLLIEPDERLGKFLADTIGRASPRAKVTIATFEQAELQAESFDIGASASAFHWLDEMASLHKIHRVLRPGGWWAMWWNLFFGAPREDEFYKASRAFLDDLDLSPSSGRGGRPAFALDTETRIANLRSGEFENIEVESVVWSVTFDTARMTKLYRTFSPISRLEVGDQQRLLDNLADIAEKTVRGRGRNTHHDAHLYGTGTCMNWSNFESSLLPASWDAAMNKYPRQQGPSRVHRCMGNVKAAALGSTGTRSVRAAN